MNDQPKRCSFCGTSSEHANVLIASFVGDSHICDYCIASASEQATEYLAKASAPSPFTLEQEACFRQLIREEIAREHREACGYPDVSQHPSGDNTDGEGI